MPEVSVDSSLIMEAKKLYLSAEKEMKGTISLETSDSSFFGDIVAALRSRCEIIRASVNSASRSSPRNLSQTQYGFEPMIDGQQYMMYNKPMDTVRTLIRKQGQNSRNMSGTCGLCLCANMLRLAGVTGVTEHDVINVALTCSEYTRKLLEIDNPDPGERGGTTVAGRYEILSRYNLQTDVYQIPSDRNEAVSYLAQQVSSGHGVIISADPGVLWNDPYVDYNKCFNGRNKMFNGYAGFFQC